MRHFNGPPHRLSFSRLPFVPFGFNCFFFLVSGFRCVIARRVGLARSIGVIIGFQDFGVLLKNIELRKITNLLGVLNCSPAKELQICLERIIRTCLYCRTSRGRSIYGRVTDLQWLCSWISRTTRIPSILRNNHHKPRIYLQLKREMPIGLYCLRITGPLWIYSMPRPGMLVP